MKAIIYNYKIWINEIESKVLVPKLNELLQKSNYKILNFVEHNFKPQGYTCLWLLAESHLAVHTFPEEQKAYIELSSCNEVMNNDFIINLEAWIDNKNIRINLGEKLITKA